MHTTHQHCRRHSKSGICTAQTLAVYATSLPYQLHDRAAGNGHMVNQGMPLRVIQRDTTHAVQTVCSSSCWTSKLHTQPKLLPNLFHSTAHARRYTCTPSVSQCTPPRLGTSRLTANLHNGTGRECLAGARTPTDDAERGIHGNLHRSKLFVAQVHRRI